MDNHTQILIPYPEQEFWDKFRDVVRAELQKFKKEREKSAEYAVPGMTQKPLYKSAEVCQMLQISRQTLHAWVKQKILRPYKIKSRVFFLWSDLEKLIDPNKER